MNGNDEFGGVLRSAAVRGAVEGILEDMNSMGIVSLRVEGLTDEARAAVGITLGFAMLSVAAENLDMSVVAAAAAAESAVEEAA